MSFINCASNLINDNLILGGNVLPGEAECADVTIKGRHIIIKSDSDDFKNRVLSTVFKAGKQRCIADYIIISDKVILVCEMKSNNGGNIGVQLRNTAKFVSYLIEMMQLHCQINIPSPPIKYVRFSAGMTVKQTLKGNKLPTINWNGGELFQLRCNSSYILNQFE